MPKNQLEKKITTKHVRSPQKTKRATLVDALDKVLDKGAYVEGGAMITLADVDMIYLGIRLMLTSASRIKKDQEKRTYSKEFKKKQKEEIAKLAKQVKEIEESIPKILEGSGEHTDKGLARLVLTIIELVRQLLEREAMRRIAQGTLDESEIERLGLSLKALSMKIEQMKKIFGIDEDLNIDLGPIGKLM